MIDKEFQHKYITELSCVVLDFTNRGYKLKTTIIYPGKRKKPKTKIEYADNIDFDKDKGHWVEKINNNL